MEYIRKCPKCNKEIKYFNSSKLNRAINDNSHCRSCAYSGRISPLKGKKQSEDHIKKRAAGVSRYRKGKTEIELYGEEKAKEVALKKSKSLLGKKRQEFSGEWKKNMSESRKNSKVYKDWMNSGEYKNKRREINAMRYYGISLEDWYAMTTEKRLYYLKVRSITRSQPLKTLKDYDKRGNSKNDGYHLDHIYPISLGFTNNIPAEEIGNIKNLRYIPWLENILKSNKNIE